MDPEKLMNGIARELEAALRAMAKAKTVEEKAQYSVIVKNLSDSLGVFFHLAAEMLMEDPDGADYAD